MGLVIFKSINFYLLLFRKSSCTKSKTLLDALTNLTVIQLFYPNQIITMNLINICAVINQ